MTKEFFFLTPQSITFDEANIAMTKHWVRVVVKYLVIIYGQNAVVINATQGIFSS